jgi:DNA recombination protein RmuC
MMDKVIFSLLGQPITGTETLLSLGGILLCLLLWRTSFLTAKSSERNRQMDQTLFEMARRSGELAQRLNIMTEVLGSRQSDLAKLFADRLDAVGARVGLGLETSAKTAGEHLGKLNERLAVIDAAQARLTGLAEEVISLKDILSNKQTRGAYGQGRMEAIIRDCLPSCAYAFQATLSNNTRPDCIVRLPGDDRVMVIDAKFPLESFAALKDAASEDARRQAMARVRTDVGKHIRDIAERYFLTGETQDLALLFIPSESLYADLVQHFEDVMQRAHQAHVIIVSPQLLMMAVQLMQAIVRDGLMREQTHIIKIELRHLVEDVSRLTERATKLDQHFKQAQDDVNGILTASAKIDRRGKRIEDLDFSTEPDHDPRLPRAAE